VFWRRCSCAYSALAPVRCLHNSSSSSSSSSCLFAQKWKKSQSSDKCLVDGNSRAVYVYVWLPRYLGCDSKKEKKFFCRNWLCQTALFGRYVKSAMCVKGYIKYCLATWTIGIVSLYSVCVTVCVRVSFVRDFFIMFIATIDWWNKDVYIEAQL